MNSKLNNFFTLSLCLLLSQVDSIVPSFGIEEDLEPNVAIGEASMQLNYFYVEINR